MGVDNPLHRARLELGIDLADVARRTRLSPQVLQNIDGGRFEQLPPGLYARSYVRAFATAVNLDPEETVRHVADRLRPAEDPLPVLREVAQRTTPAWLVSLGGWAARLTPWLAGFSGPGARLAAWRRSLSVWGVRQRLWLAAPQRLMRSWAHLSSWNQLHQRAPGRRVGAVCTDGALLVLLHVLLVSLTAWACGVTRADVIASAGSGVTAVWGVLVLQYFLLLGGIGGRTPGAWLLNLRGAPPSTRTEPLGLRAIVDRAIPYWGSRPTLN